MDDKLDKQKPFSKLDISKYPPEVTGRFNSFIATQFDDSLSVEMQIRSMFKWAIDNFKEMDQTYSDFTEYLIVYINEVVDALESNEMERQNEFEENEQDREYAESVRVANETERISKDSERDSKIENLQSEVVSARGGEAVLGDRLDRIESAAGEGSTEITIEDFIGFQDAIGGRNLLVERTKTPTHSGSRWESYYMEVEPNGVYSFSFSGGRQWDQIFEYNADKEEVAHVSKTSTHGDFVHVVSDDTHFIRYISGTNNVHNNAKIEVGEKTTPYTLAPEDYEEVTLADLANHANIIFGGEFTKLRNAIIAMGGAIV